MINGFGRNDCPSAVRQRVATILAGRLTRMTGAVAILAAAVVLLARYTDAQDRRDLDDVRRREIERERRLEDRDLGRARRLDDREIERDRRAPARVYLVDNRTDPRAIERRSKVYDDLRRDFGGFDRDGFSADSAILRSRSAPRTGIVESQEALGNVRRIFDRFAQEADGLRVALCNDVDYIRGVRGILPDVIQFSANAQVLRDRCGREQRLANLCSDFESLDRDWQAISYKLRQISGLTQTAAKRVEVMNSLDRELSGILKIQPQFDQRVLLRQTAALCDELLRLADDINVELVDLEQRRVLSNATRRAQSEAQGIYDAIDAGGDLAAASQEFQEYLALWRPLVQQIRRVDVNRAMARTVNRIHRKNQEIAQSLRAPQQNDNSNLGYMMEELKHDIDEYFTRAPLKLVMDLPESRTALVTAGEFYGNCEQFLQDAADNSSQADLADSFRTVAESWRAFDHAFRPMNSEPARRVLNKIEDGINSIGDSLQLYDQQFDRRKLSELSYGLVAAAENIYRDTRAWINHDQFDASDDALRATESFVRRCQRFSDAVSGTATIEQLRAEIVNVYEHYKQVYGFIVQCRGRERLRLGENAKRAKDALVDLRTLLAI